MVIVQRFKHWWANDRYWEDGTLRQQLDAFRDAEPTLAPPRRHISYIAQDGVRRYQGLFNETSGRIQWRHPR